VGLRIALGQIDARVGDVDGNVERVLDAWRRAAEQDADLIVFTELTVTGYPPEDLLLKPEFVDANLQAIERLAAEGPAGTTALVGYVGAGEGDATDAEHWDVALATRDLTNSVAVIRDGSVRDVYDKLRLPNYGVFDEARYFTPRDEPCVIDVAGVPVGITVCEDLWTEEGPASAAVAAGARVLANLNASPYHRGKAAEREAWARYQAEHGDAYVLYCNVVGGQDEVVFDGASFVVAPNGRHLARGAQFAEDLVLVDLDVEADDTTTERAPLPARDEPERLDEVGEVWAALTRATRDYCLRNGFDEAIIGLSGGIDSAVAAAIAADALGGDRLLTVAMPSPYSSEHSVTDAEALARNLGSEHHEVPITGPLFAAGDMLGDLVITGFDRDDGKEPGTAYENLQSRLRGMTLMALSNERDAIVLTTGNKSEYAVGYATLYGDMAGGFAPLKDVPKLLVYELARWRNRDGEFIPSATVEKEPSAELRPDQVDSDSLPAYEVLDDIIAAYVELDLGIEAIVERGHDREMVRRIVALVDGAEFKRRQGPPGPKITERAFGRDRRVPITNGWRG
jgi:NAD+ synthase (glutamine-hydrolysing)